MESPRKPFDLEAELGSLRSVPRAEFAAGLDARAAAGFPRGSRLGRLNRISFARGLDALSLRWTAIAACGVALVAIAVATAVVTSNESTSNPLALNRRSTHPSQVEFSKSIPVAPSRSAAPSDESLSSAAGAGAGTTGPQVTRLSHRDIERSTEIGLLANPQDVTNDSAKVFSAVHDANGIVLHSTTTQGRHAGAHFDLLIPSAKLGDAMAAFSAIDQVRTRHEATADITASTVTTGERLHGSRARIDSLLSQLAGAQTESEAAVIEGRLDRQRRLEAALRSRLARLHRRTAYSRVDLRIETGASSESSGSWGLGKALGDAGHILSVAAGVTLVGLAVLSPLALLALLAWLVRRTWLRHARNRALA